jgi:hypothetical protein
VRDWIENGRSLEELKAHAAAEDSKLSTPPAKLALDSTAAEQAVPA